MTGKSCAILSNLCSSASFIRRTCSLLLSEALWSWKNGNMPLNCLPMSSEGDRMFAPNGVEIYSIKAMCHDVFACRHLFISDLTVLTAHSTGLLEWWYLEERVTTILSCLQNSINWLDTKLHPWSHLIVEGNPSSLKTSSSSLTVVMEVKSWECFTTVNLLKWSTMIKYSLPFSSKLSMAKAVHGLVLAGSFSRDSVGCFSWYVAQARHLDKQFSISWFKFGQKKLVLALFFILTIPMWDVCSTFNASSCIVKSIRTWCPFRIRPSHIANSSLSLK